MIWIAGMAVLLGCVVARDASAAPKRVCEEWRDYNFNAENGDFIEWVGDPYWVCYDTSEPISYARPPEHSSYGGGVPYPQPSTPRDRCRACRQRYDACMDQVDQGIDACIEHYAGMYRRQCVRRARGKNGRRYERKVECRMVHIEGYKPHRLCSADWIEECVDTYREDSPGSSSERGMEVNIGMLFEGVGELAVKLGQKRSVSWPASMGFETACTNTGAVVSQTCLSQKTTCTKDLEGCR